MFQVAKRTDPTTRACCCDKGKFDAEGRRKLSFKKVVTVTNCHLLALRQATHLLVAPQSYTSLRWGP